MAYSPVTKAAIDAADEFIEALDAAWADIDESFHFDDDERDDPNGVVEVETHDKSSLTNETICGLNSFKRVPKDVHVKNVMDVVSPLAESHRVNRGKEMSPREDFKVVRTELNKIKKEMEILGDEGNLSEKSDKETLGARTNEDIQHGIVCNTCKERSSKCLVEKGINTSDENIPPCNRIESSHNESIIKTENINLQKKIDQLEEELSQAFKKNVSLEKELSQSKSKTIQMEKTWLESKAQQDEMKESYCNRIKELIQQNHYSQQQVKLAEEDANTALKLATESDTKRHEMELVLEMVVKELELVKGCPFEENELNGSTPLKNESIWNTIGGKDSESVLDESDASSSAFSLEPLDTPHSSENESVRDNDQTCKLPNALDYDSHESMMRVHNIVRTSGMQLNLPGKWFSKSMLSVADVDTESISKSYCMLVENVIRQQRDELNELKEFCSYLEGKLVG
jgi:hypothetical protein